MTDQDSRAPYLQLAADLRRQIEAGELAPGEQLPSNRALAAKYGVAVLTAQKAVHALRAEGLLDTQPGLGVFVREARGERRMPEPKTYEDIIRSLDALHEDVRHIARRLDELEATAPTRGTAKRARQADGTGSTDQTQG